MSDTSKPVPPVAGDETLDEKALAEALLAYGADAKAYILGHKRADERGIAYAARFIVSAYLAALRPAPDAVSSTPKRTDVDCIKCGRPVGNTVFTVCDDCWPSRQDIPAPSGATEAVAWEWGNRMTATVQYIHGPRRPEGLADADPWYLRPLYAAPPAPASAPNTTATGDITATVSAPASGEQRADVTANDVEWAIEQASNACHNSQYWRDEGTWDAYIQPVLDRLAALRARQGESNG